MASQYTTNMGMIPVQWIPPSSTNPFGFQAPADLTQQQALDNKQLIIDGNAQLAALMESLKPKQPVPPPATAPTTTASINPDFYFIVGGLLLVILIMKK
jgi:hypothetical protein